ncbi:unnamed protein product [Onchocerca ochengi]|uniref:Uncharacterized protein n=1 Tax=Onchocerca ochengi TaxID=42157 RepID=A0A182DY00_ONCOC|nr:unnamed protein product [Onchocerca ochengi]
MTPKALNSPGMSSKTTMNEEITNNKNNYNIKKNYDTLRTRRRMFVPRGLEAGGDAAAQQVEERLRAQRETRNDALRFLLIPVVLELGAHFCTFVLGWDWICT